jgi:membrane fusion protein (multidrug efflux system)
VAGEAKVDLLLEDGSKYPHPGRLQFSEVNVDQTTGTVVLRALFPNPDKLLLPGLYVRAELQEGTDDRAIVVPQQAVSHNAHGDATVLVVGADGHAALRTIVTSRALGSTWIVTSGLADGDRVIVDGLQQVKPGMPVQPTPASATAAN